jgi:glycosyltransferase involved in cell wall biosynthesis
VLHYLGYDRDRGGIVSVVRALAGAGRFECVLGLNRNARQLRQPALPAAEVSPVAGEILNVRTFWRARAVAREAHAWLDAAPGRVFHGHSRAGLAVALWLARQGEARAVVSVHCYGRQRWFYRWAAGRLRDRLFWLSPAMKEYYGVAGGEAWAQCIPECVPAPVLPRASRIPATDGALRLGGIGALVPWKRWHLVLEALALMPATVREKWRFRHIGGTDGSPVAERYSVQVQARTKELGLDDCVEWLGEQPSADGMLGETDCLVVASYHEPFSVAMLEALQAGVPVLAADSGGARDVIVPMGNGWLFRSGDARDLSRMLTMLVESDALARVRIDPSELTRFSAETVAGQWAEVYARLLAVK